MSVFRYIFIFWRQTDLRYVYWLILIYGSNICIIFYQQRNYFLLDKPLFHPNVSRQEANLQTLHEIVECNKYILIPKFRTVGQPGLQILLFVIFRTAEHYDWKYTSCVAFILHSQTIRQLTQWIWWIQTLWQTSLKTSNWKFTFKALFQSSYIIFNRWIIV